VSHAAEYSALLRAHIDKENKKHFPLGDKKIPLDAQSELIISFEEFEEKVMGTGTHEKLHALLQDFQAKYL